jgi:hypothetical protein
MVRVIAPLMSMDASGTLAKSHVFAKWKGRNYVRRHAIPANPRSGLQVAMRQILKFITQNYPNWDANAVADWKAAAATDNITPLNAQVRDAGKRARDNKGIRADTHTDATAAASAPTMTAAAETRGVKLTITAGANAPDYVWLIYRKQGADPTGVIPELIAVQTAATLTYTDADVTANLAYSYKAIGCNKDGTLGTLQAASATATPTA